MTNHSSDPTDRAVPYPDLDAIPADLRDAVTARGSINVYRMVTHSPGLAPAFLGLADAVLRANSLPADLRELAIVRVGHTYHAAYEIHHHERIGRACGLTDAALDAARTGDSSALQPTEQNIIRWTGLLLDTHRLDDPERSEVVHALGMDGLADLVLTVGFYQLVCNFLNTFDVTTDGETPPRLRPATAPAAD
ncbi:MAG: hypothetical protein RL238_3069 [Actinomycetota bacterium]|jgi:4-carboxymuconolactone decarboxylase